MCESMSTFMVMEGKTYDKHRACGPLKATNPLFMERGAECRFTLRAGYGG